ncbi:hypothetical protein GLIP_3963 [Aliiglaciecola lipolytica E3]|uniref:Uncharacterized protein n=1 Tax=Aliiglaciecola lipolytica E3 TaxID=1127673 RepID=K6X7H5_9ALTE|nr:hypothetical protein GLIP_3963 [Aliiglaciecola lipolytica E3]
MLAANVKLNKPAIISTLALVSLPMQLPTCKSKMSIYVNKS